MEEHEKIELRSQEVQEILGTPPRWIIRWGSTIAFLTFCVLLLASYLISYPDIISAKVELISNNPPVDVNAKITANISTLYVIDNQQVEEGQLLLVLDDLAKYDDIMTLEEQLDEQLAVIDENALMNFVPIEDLQLGELQELYSEITQIREVFTFGTHSNFAGKNIGQINQEIESLRQLIRKNKSRKESLNLELQTARAALKIIKKRYGNKTADFKELNENIQKVKRLATDSTNLLAGQADLELQITRLQKSINTIRTESGENKFNSLSFLQSKVSRLKNKIRFWKEKHEILAPASGQVVFAVNLTENQAVRQDEKLMTIVPQEEQSFYGKVELPIKGSGKVNEGQQVVIKFDNYPYKEYGVVKGKVAHKAILPQNQVYNIRVELDNKLLTSYGNELAFTQGMQGTAEIITKDRRFIQRLFENMTAFAEDY